MMWFKKANDKKDKPKLPASPFSITEQNKPKPGELPYMDVPQDSTIRDIYRLPEHAYKKWSVQNPEERHFLMTHFIDNIYKVHRPGKLTHRRQFVPIQEVANWAKAASAQGVSDAFVLLTDWDLEYHYGIKDEKGHRVKSGKDVLKETYDAYGIQIHNNLQIRDFGVPRMSSIIEGCKELKETSEETEKQGTKVVVHCSAGIGRTGLFTSAYLIYTNRLNSDDIGAVQDRDMTSRISEFYSQKPSPVSLSKMQNKVWYDTRSQLEFLFDFAKLKERYEKEGKKIDDPEVINDIRVQDIKNEEEELKKQEERKQFSYDPDIETSVSSKQKFHSPGGSINDWWKEYNRRKGRGDAPAQDDDVIDVDDDEVEEEWVRGADGNWYLADDLSGINDLDFLSENDIPPESYVPSWMEEAERKKEQKRKREIEKLKRKNKTRPYIDIGDEAHDEYYDDLEEFSTETMDDDEWMERFGQSWFSRIKQGQPRDEEDRDDIIDDGKKDTWYEKFRKFRNRQNTEPSSRLLKKDSPVEDTYYSDTPVTSVIGDRVFKGKRPGYPSRYKIPDEIITDYAQKMKDRGITDVFVFLNDNELQKYYDNRLFSIYEKHGLDVHHYPIEDFSVPSLQMALEFAEDLDQTIQEGGKALLHCSAGIGRTGIMLSIYELYKGKDPNFFGQSVIQENFVKEFRKFLKQETSVSDLPPGLKSSGFLVQPQRLA